MPGIKRPKIKSNHIEEFSYEVMVPRTIVLTESNVEYLRRSDKTYDDKCSHISRTHHIALGLARAIVTDFVNYHRSRS